MTRDYGLGFQFAGLGMQNMANVQGQNYSAFQTLNQNGYNQSYAGMTALLAAQQNALQPLPPPRFRSIDPTQRLSDKAILLLCVNRALRDA